MRVRLLALTILVVAATAPSSASAGPPDDAAYAGRCSLAATSNRTQLLDPSTRWRGILGGVAVGYAPTAGHNPVSAYLSCDVRVNGVLVASADIVQSGVVTQAADMVVFTAYDTDHVAVCDDVRTWDAHGQRKSWYVCHDAYHYQVLPEAMVDAVCVSDFALCQVLHSNRTAWLVSGPL